MRKLWNEIVFQFEKTIGKLWDENYTKTKLRKKQNNVGVR